MEVSIINHTFEEVCKALSDNVLVRGFSLHTNITNSRLANTDSSIGYLSSITIPLKADLFPSSYLKFT